MPKSTVVELLYGEGAHANTLACVEDVSFDVAGQRAGNCPYSIWELVQHLNFWMGYELKRIRHENPAYPAHASESWPSEPAPRTPAEWQESVALFRSHLAELVGLSDSPPDVLARQVAATHPVHMKQSNSMLSVLWQTLVHNSYHAGQIVMLRRVLGAWPPEQGGDSW